jgi:predicted nucleotide-binding protein (sugar kinase/HSP70/actin superfamily)
MSDATTLHGVNGTGAKKKLKIADQALDLDAELARFEEEERRRLGLDGKTEQWIEDMVNLQFTRSERANVTILIGGLTLAHDYLIEGGLRGIGYNVQMLDVPDTMAFQTGKEFGNRGQCNPTYFTVGNLIKYLITLRDKHGLSSEKIVKKYIFLTAGACGPCRFGMYVTEYRKALRDAGFDGFRVLLFQQTGGLKQATGEELGLELNATFFWAILKGMFAGDVLNAYGYRVRPYEKNKGETDAKLEQCKAILYDALANRKNIVAALWKCKPILRSIEIDRTIVKPKVSIIGEFWAMTTEGDGNYQLQRFLESEGAECDIQLVAAWMLYMLWEVRNDAKERADLREWDTAKYGLGGGGPFAVLQKLAISHLGDKAVKAIFQVFAHAAGLYGYKFASMEEIADVAHDFYNNDLRGGEGHMEVGKLIVNVIHQKCHMTLSVKPFGCMPSAGVSDGVQTAITEKYPGTIFCPVETSGDGRVNFYSRVQMYLFKAKQAAQAEYERALEEHGVTREQVAAALDAHPRFRNPLFKPKHVYCGSSADIVAAVAPYITKTRAERWRDRVARLVSGGKAAAQKTPHLAISLVHAVKDAPKVAERMKEDIAILRDLRARKKQSATREATLDAAAEE